MSIIIFDCIEKNVCVLNVCKKLIKLNSTRNLQKIKYFHAENILKTPDYGQVCYQILHENCFHL